MHRTFFYLASLLCVIAPAVLRAQAPACPTGPLVGAIPDFTQWTMTEKVTAEEIDALGAGAMNEKPASPADTPTPTTNPAEGAGAEASTTQSKSVSGQRTGDITHVLTILNGGAKNEAWRRGAAQAILCTGWERPIVSEARGDDFEGALSWVSPNNFQGIVQANGVDCMVFKTENAGAVIEVARRLPVLIRLKQENVGVAATVDRVYQYAPMPSHTMLTIPAEFASAMSALEQAVKEEQAIPDRP